MPRTHYSSATYSDNASATYTSVQVLLALICKHYLSGGRLNKGKKMKLCIDYLREIEAKNSWSRYRIGKELGISSARIYQLFDNGGTYDDGTALRVAEILGIDPNLVVASAHFEREKNPQIKQFWMNLTDKLSLGFNVLIECVNPRGIKLST